VGETCAVREGELLGLQQIVGFDVYDSREDVGSTLAAVDVGTFHDHWYFSTTLANWILAHFALKSASVYDGRHVRWAGTRTLRCRTLAATSDEEVLLDVDGEQPGRLPATFEILPGALRLQI